MVPAAHPVNPWEERTGKGAKEKEKISKDRQLHSWNRTEKPAIRTPHKA
jgi:hypothetical protein